jgi:hypothetical protein
MGIHKDPAVFTRMQLVETFIEIMGKAPEMRSGVQRLWRISAARLKRQRSRWQRVICHVDAVIATLFDLKWTPVDCDLWTDLWGEAWKIDFKDVEHVWSTLHHILLLRYIGEGLWAGAAAQPDGNGLQEGAALTVVGKHLRRLRENGADQREGFLLTAVQG